MKTLRFAGLLQQLEELGFTRNDVLLCGSAPLAVRGLRDVNDLDVLFTSEAYARFVANLGPWVRPPDDNDPDSAVAAALDTAAGIIQGTTDIFNFATKVGFTTADVWQHAELWEGWRVLALDDMVCIKAAIARPKDLADLALLKTLS